MKKIGLFGGTFDPFHNTHLDILIAAKQQLGFDEVWVLIDKEPRRKSSVTDYQHRLEMAKLATVEYDFIVVDRLDMQKNGVTHSLVTQKELCKKYRDCAFTIILGMDSVQFFDKWEKPEKFCELVDFAIVKRPEHISDLQPMLDRLGDAAKIFKYVYINFEPSRVSSSKIRKQVKLKKTVDGLHPEVIEYIQRKRLYE